MAWESCHCGETIDAGTCLSLALATTSEVASDQQSKYLASQQQCSGTAPSLRREQPSAARTDEPSESWRGCSWSMTSPYDGPSSDLGEEGRRRTCS